MLKGDAALALPPLDQRGQQLGLEVALVADEVVVHEEDRRRASRAGTGRPARRRSAPAVLMRGRWPEQRGDVAEVAVVRAAARELDAHRGVAPEVRQLPARRRGLAEVGELAGRVDAPRAARSRSAQERGRASAPPRSARSGPPRGTARARAVNSGPPATRSCRAALAARDEPARRFALRDHGARRTTMSAQARSRSGQLCDVEVHQPLAPVRAAASRRR